MALTANIATLCGRCGTSRRRAGSCSVSPGVPNLKMDPSGACATQTAVSGPVKGFRTPARPTATRKARRCASSIASTADEKGPARSSALRRPSSLFATPLFLTRGETPQGQAESGIIGVSYLPYPISVEGKGLGLGVCYLFTIGCATRPCARGADASAIAFTACGARPRRVLGAIKARSRDKYT
jgi:hypothetical protein